MKIKIHMVLVVTLLLPLMTINTAAAADCSNAMISVLLEEGLTQEQINRICLKAAMKEEGLSDDQISRIMSKSEGTVPAASAMTAPARGPSPAVTPAPVAVQPAPAVTIQEISPDFPPSKIDADIVGKCVGGILGWCFEKDEYREIEVLETRVDRRRARVIFHVSTIKNRSGKMIATYQQVGTKWQLDSLEPIDFK